MGGKQKAVRSFEEDIYWTHFQFIHFTQFLHSGFDQHLALPKTFSDNIKKKLPENVSLKGPGGVVWNIGLTTKDDTLYFAHGWEQFARDHSLKENDFLVFKYNGESLFEVLIFDGETSCEKAASYFVRQCGPVYTEQPGGAGGYSSKRKDTTEEVNTPPNGGVDVECASPEKSVHANGKEVPLATLASGTSNGKTFNAGVESPYPEQFMADAATQSNPGASRFKRRGRPPKSSYSHSGALTWISDNEGKGKAGDDGEFS